MSDGIDQAEEQNQRDQAEGERDDKMEQRVTRGPHGGTDEGTRQQNVAERDPAEGREDVDA
jgi:hypothetical protein